jgi:NADP-dependent 3-hydroxy acid dehydrogenase YdfG
MSDDPVFLITGAGSGIGAATARHAAEAGYRLVLGARSADKLEALATELGGEERAIAVPTDVTEWADNEALAAAATDRFGRLDVAFANAGFGAARGWLKETPEHWRDMVLTNVLGAAYTVRAAIPALKASKGHVLLTGSVAGRRVLPGSLYSATKWGGDRDGRGDPRRPRRHRHPHDADRAGHGRHAVLRRPGEGRLEPDDIARAVMYAISQPPHVDVNEILIRPTAQPT